MELFLIIISVVLIVLSVLPFVRNQHWVFRVPEFLKIQILALQGIVLPASIMFAHKSIWIWLIHVGQFLLILYHLYILIRYTKFYKKKAVQKKSDESATVKLISANVYQFNKDFSKFHQLIQKYRPDIFITMESNADWERANRRIEEEYPFTEKVTLENTYGMHLYSKIPFVESTVHFFVAADVPSIEAQFKTPDGQDFVLFAVHPPPPSPTEETTSKERDGDLLCVAKKIKEHRIPSLVIGDFNTVAWSLTSILFRKTSELIDARVGRGILATFHAQYWFFRVPLDLLFHAPEIFVDKLKTLESIGSDHFPIFCEFHLNPYERKQENEVTTLAPEEEEMVDELIEEGRKESSDNRGAVAKKG